LSEGRIYGASAGFSFLIIFFTGIGFGQKTYKKLLALTRWTLLRVVIAKMAGGHQAANR
jgi:hypothetical protein